MQLQEGRYNNKVLGTALITNFISAILVIWWQIGFHIMNIDFLGNIASVFPEAEAGNLAYQIFCHFDWFLAGVMLLALVLDTVDVSVSTLRK